MAVKIRMTRMGRRHRPFFRINAIDARTPRDGRILEKLGHYDPLEKDPAKQIVLNRQRIQYWLDSGAVPSETVSEILLRHGIKHKFAEQKAVRMARAKAQAHAKGKLFTQTEKIAAERVVEKKAADEKAAVEAKAAAEKAAQEAKAKAEAEEKAAAEKATAEAKAATEKAAQEAKAKAKAEEKAADKKAAVEAKVADEKAAQEAKAKAEPEKPEAEAKEEKPETAESSEEKSGPQA